MKNSQVIKILSFSCVAGGLLYTIYQKGFINPAVLVFLASASSIVALGHTFKKDKPMIQNKASAVLYVLMPFYRAAVFILMKEGIEKVLSLCISSYFQSETISLLSSLFSRFYLPALMNSILWNYFCYKNNSKHDDLDMKTLAVALVPAFSYLITKCIFGAEKSLLPASIYALCKIVTDEHASRKSNSEVFVNAIFSAVVFEISISHLAPLVNSKLLSMGLLANPDSIALIAETTRIIFSRVMESGKNYIQHYISAHPQTNNQI